MTSITFSTSFKETPEGGGASAEEEEEDAKTILLGSGYHH